MSDTSYEIKQRIGTLSSHSKGWKKEINLISWNGHEPKYDIRDWDDEHSKMGKGVTLSKSELKELYSTLKEMFEGEKVERQVQPENIGFEINSLQQKAPMFVEEIKNILLFMDEQGCPLELQRAILMGISTEEADESLQSEMESLSGIYSVYYQDLVRFISDLNENELTICLSLIKDPTSNSIPESSVTEDEIYYCKGKDARASGRFTSDGFVVHKGSICNLVESATAGWIKKIRSELKEKRILVQSDQVFVLTEDCTFKSPSAAAGVVLARRANGWTEWKNENGLTLDQLKR